MQSNQNQAVSHTETGKRPDRRVVVVVPTFNERETLPILIRAIMALNPYFHVIVVDDQSPDGTGALADELARQFSGRMEVIHRPGKSGIGSAYVEGIRIALRQGAPAIALMDADLSHDPAYLPEMTALMAEWDLVLGSRYVQGGTTIGWSRWRQILSQAGGLFARIVLRTPVADMTSGFRVMRREAVRSLVLDEITASGFAFNLELTQSLICSGSTVKELPIVFRERTAGASKLTPGIVVEGLVVVWKLRRMLRSNRANR